MKPSAILRKAAELVDSDEFWFGCNALDFICNGLDKNPSVKEYFMLLRPIGEKRYVWWRKDDKARVIGLLFAAAIAKSEGN